MEQRITPLVMVVEDEAALLTMLRYNLEKEGYLVCEATSGEEALLVAEEDQPDLVLLDWMLPGLSGIEVCRRLRRQPLTRSTPIIMVTARGEEGEKVRGLNTGADDYMTKPFSLPELMARIRALLRRAQPVVTNQDELVCGDLVLNLTRHHATRGKRGLDLGPTEFRMLHFLMKNPGTVFSREDLLDAVWGPNIYVELRTVDVHIRRLRKSLNHGDEVDMIRTVRGAGYALNAA